MFRAVTQPKVPYIDGNLPEWPNKGSRRRPLVTIPERKAVCYFTVLVLGLTAKCIHAMVAHYGGGLRRNSYAEDAIGRSEQLLN